MTDPRVALERCSYRTVGGVPLEARLLVPDDAQEPRPAIAYFHPGAWRAGGPALTPELQYLASRGMVAAAFGYRLLPSRGRQQSSSRSGYAMRYDAARSIGDCVADAQAAIRWLRKRPEVDGTRVVAAGYSAGAHLAAATALLPSVEPARTSCRPNALVLYAGVFDLGRATELSPLHHVRPKAPPSLILCGDSDSLVSQARRFALAMSDAGNRCELAEFRGGHHAFTSRLDNPTFAPALERVDQFLVSLGYVDPVVDFDRRVADLAASAPKARQKPSSRMHVASGRPS